MLRSNSPVLRMAFILAKYAKHSLRLMLRKLSLSCDVENVLDIDYSKTYIRHWFSLAFGKYSFSYDVGSDLGVDIY